MRALLEALTYLAKIGPIDGHNFETVQGLNRYRKSNMGFRLVPKSVTLNSLERRNGHVHGGGPKK